MAPRYMSDRVKLLLTLTVLLMFVISTASTNQCTSEKTERDVYVIRSIGIKLCHLKCAEHGQCASIEYDIETLTCRLLRDESKVEKKEGHVILESSHLHVPTASCTSGMCSFGQRCLKTRSGKEVCVQASRAEANKDLTPCKADPPPPVTTQNSEPNATVRDLYSASEVGDLQRVKQILAVGHVDINTRGHNSRTPVMVAAWNGRSDVVEFLVGRGADALLVDRGGNNVLHLACRRGHVKTVKLILCLDVLNMNSRGDNCRTPVMLAAWRGHRDVVEFLVGRGADVSLVDEDGDNALHLACMYGDLETVKLTLSLDVLDINSRGRYRRTPVMWAERYGQSVVLEFLVRKGADVSLVDEDGNNVLHFACNDGDLETVKLLLSVNMIDINARNNRGRTAAYMANFKGFQPVLDLLVSHGAH